MNLYIWSYDINFGASVVFAVANSVEEAKRAVAEGRAFCGSSEWTHKKGDMGYLATEILGDPDRVVALDRPYAEWHEWSE